MFNNQLWVKGAHLDLQHLLISVVSIFLPWANFKLATSHRSWQLEKDVHVGSQEPWSAVINNYSRKLYPWPSSKTMQWSQLLQEQLQELVTRQSFRGMVQLFISLTAPVPCSL